MRCLTLRDIFPLHFHYFLRHLRHCHQHYHLIRPSSLVLLFYSSYHLIVTIYSLSSPFPAVPAIRKRIWCYNDFEQNKHNFFRKSLINKQKKNQITDRVSYIHPKFRIGRKGKNVAFESTIIFVYNLTLKIQYFQ